MQNAVKVSQENRLKTGDDLFQQYSSHRLSAVRFDDFTIRHGLIEAVTNPVNQQFRAKQ